MSGWERLTGYIPGDGGEDMRLARMPVPGGWLYRTVEIGLGVALAFVPEPVPIGLFSPSSPPPSDLAAEQGVLGILLRRHQEGAAMLPGIDSRYLADPLHVLIVHAMLDLRGRPNAIIEHFENSGLLDEVGGAQYLRELVAQAPPETDFPNLLDRVRRAWGQRMVRS